MSNMVIPKSSLLTVSTGDCSDYNVSGVFRALEEINADALLENWLLEHPEQKEPYKFSETSFLAYVTKLGLLEPLDSFEWHLGNYACVEEMWVRNADHEN